MFTLIKATPFMYTGINIRNNASESVGSRKPIATGNSKNETIPISSILLSMSEKADMALFLDHWEDLSGSYVDDTLSGQGLGEVATGPLYQTEPYYPMSFFESSRSKRALPFTCKSLRTDTFAGHLATLRNTLPANPGDLLWLIDRFLSEEFANGGAVKLMSGSEHEQSIYRLISKFCSKAKYKHHPHLRTLKAMVSVVEMGATERLIATNALTFAFNVLRSPCKKQSRSLNVKIKKRSEGRDKKDRFETKSTSYFALTVGGTRTDNTIRDLDEPELECDVEVVDDFTDDEMLFDEQNQSDAGDEMDVDEPAGSSSPRKRMLSQSEGKSTHGPS